MRDTMTIGFLFNTNDIEIIAVISVMLTKINLDVPYNLLLVLLRNAATALWFFASCNNSLPQRENASGHF